MPNVGDLSAEELQHLFKQGYETNVTETAHRELYPALSPSNPELNQAGKVVLITGGGTGVGYAISRAFVQASADTVIILGRRSKVLATAASKLEQEAKAAGTDTKIVTRTCDVTNLTEVKAFWKDLAAKGVEVDVFVANAVKFSEPKPILELGAAEIWTQFEANVKSPLHMVENFHSQPGEKQKSIAQNVPPEKMQITSFHPGLIYTDEWKAIGTPPDWFDNDELCGAFAVWLATKQAEFLHGRFLWASWNIEQLTKGDFRKRIDEDPYYLRASIVGLENGMRA